MVLTAQAIKRLMTNQTQRVLCRVLIQDGVSGAYPTHFLTSFQSEHHVCGQRQAEVVLAAQTMELLVTDWLQRVKNKMKWPSQHKP